MNMKKTMAAIAAGAVAVSAMATTVSAEDANTLWGNKTVTFNLVQTVEKVTGYKGTIVSTIDRLPLAAGSLVIDITDLDNDDVVTVSGYYIEDNKPIRTMVFTQNQKDARYSPAGSAAMDITAPNHKITIPVIAAGTSTGSDFTIEESATVGAGVYLNIMIEKSVDDSAGMKAKYENSEKVRAALTAGTVKVTLTNGTSVYSSEPADTIANFVAALPTSADGWAEVKETKKYPYYTNTATPLGGAATTTTYGNTGNALACVFKTGNAGDHAFSEQGTANEHIPVYYVTNIINDAINSYGNVTFTFNTYKEKVNDVDYNAFGKNWWQLEQNDVSGLFDDTNYWINNWENMNLFNSALIVNSNVTFSLSDAQAMKWTRDALTFDWDDVQATALNPNAFTNYVNSMVLRTGAEWYWESLVVTFEEGVAEDVTAGAGDEANDNQIPDDEDDGIDLEDDDEDDGDDFDDEDDGDDFDDEDDGDEDDGDEDDGDEGDAGDVSSPKTGNPAVALAVIPVALAAAAVVAKKRG